MFKRIDHVEMVTTDMNKTVDFYTNILGFKVRERRRMEVPTAAFTEIAYLALNDTVIELLSVKEAAQASPQALPQVGWRMIALEVEDMDKAVKYLQSKGVAITREPRSIGNSKRAEITDPNGLPIELRQW